MNREVYVKTILMGHRNSTQLGFWMAKPGTRVEGECVERKILICDVLFAESRWKKCLR